MTKHTRGPWKADKNLGCKRISAKPYRAGQSRQAKRTEICTTPGLYDEKEDKANARLIAAAPELLEVVKHLAWFIENVNDDTPGRTERFFNAREMWRNVIGKAEGN